MQKVLKKSLCYFLVLVMVLSVTPFTPHIKVKAETLVYEDENGNKWEYMIDNSQKVPLDQNTYAVKPLTLDSVSGNATVPGIINGKEVTSIFGDYTSWYNTKVTGITIPNTVINISSMAFTGWSNLQTVNFESGSKLKVIQRYAFNGCSKLTSITIPASVQEIGVLYTYPENETGFSIFAECYKLESIQVENGSNYFKSVDGVLYSLDGKTLYNYPQAKSGTSFEIPAEVTTVNQQAFSDCMNLTGITFAPNSNLTTLSYYAFGHSRNIVSFSTFPESLVDFGDWVFGDTGWLKNQITQEHPYLVINGVLLNAYYGLTVPADVTLPNNTITINDHVFSNALFAENENVNVVIPDSVTTIDNAAFYGYNNISTLKLPGSVTTIKDLAFAYMKGLKSIAIPNSVILIGDSIFSYDTALDYIYTDNELVKTTKLHETWNPFHYTFEPFDNYGKEALSGEISIAGNAEYGESLSALTTGITNSNPGAYTYDWFRVDAVTKAETQVTGTDNTYTVTADDIGYQIKLKVSSTNYSGSLNANTEIVQKADCPQVNVPVSGVVNNNGTNKNFTFTGVAGVTYEYSLDSGLTWNDVPELTDTTGNISIGNIAVETGKLNVRAKATDIYMASASISNSTPFTSSLEGNVQISGALKYNQTLTANVSGSQSNAQLVFAWYRSGSSTPVKSGSSNEYAITALDIGKTLSVKVSASGYTGNLEDSADSVVSKADAVITIATDKVTYSKNYGDADFYLEGITNNVNGAVIYNSSDSGITVTADGKTHINAATDGKYIIKIELPETDCYNAAESKSISITVEKAHTVSLSLSNLNQTSNAISVPTVMMTPYSKVAYDKIKTEYGVVSGSAIAWSQELPATEGNYKIKATLLKDEANLDNNIDIYTDITTGVQDFVITKYIVPGGGSSGNTPGGNPSSGNSGTGNDTSSTTIKNYDGSTTTTDTVKNPDGSLTTTTSTVKSDGSKTVKENTSTTATNADGSSKTTESIKETVTAADGTISIVTTNAVTNKNADGSTTKQSIIAVDSSSATAIKSVKTDKNGNITSSAATISTDIAEVTKTKKISAVSVNVPLSILNAVSDSDNTTDVSIKITTDITKTAITDKDTKSVVLTVSVPLVENVNISGAYLSKDVAGMAAEYKKDLEIKMVNGNAADYTIKISANALDKISKDMNLALNITSYKEIAKEGTKFAATLNNVLKSDSADVQIVSFSDNKALGTGVTISYNVSEIKDVIAGDKVYIYRYNSKTNKLEEVANNTVVVGKDGMITTSTINGGDFVISSDKLAGSKVTVLVDKVSVNTTVSTMKAGSKTNLKVYLPADIQKVSTFDKKTDPIGQEEAQVVYKVSNESIAQVDSKGNVTAKKSGKVEITVTVKLESGEKKTIKKTIQIR